MKSLHDRFSEKVKVGKPDECWEWLGAKTGGKHPHAIFKGPDTRSAYRQLFIWMNGPVTRDVDICHSCDNGMCVNPWHLSAGSRSDNMRQCVERGRFTPPPPHENQLRGEAAASHKLTDDHVREIRSLAAAGAGMRELGRLYGVHHNQISALLHGKTWAHVK